MGFPRKRRYNATHDPGQKYNKTFAAAATAIYAQHNFFPFLNDQLGFCRQPKPSRQRDYDDTYGKVKSLRRGDQALLIFRVWHMMRFGRLGTNSRTARAELLRHGPQVLPFATTAVEAQDVVARMRMAGQMPAVFLINTFGAREIMAIPHGTDVGWTYTAAGTGWQWWHGTPHPLELVAILERLLSPGEVLGR